MYTPTYEVTGTEKALFKTNKGSIEVELFGKDAPIHVANFCELVETEFYDNSKFHRYEPGFVVQGGDPNTVEASAEDVKANRGYPPFGTGGPGYTIQGEFDLAKNPNTHVRGALGMARSADPNSAGSQFYFTLAPANFLDGNYTVFGQVVEGYEVMDELRIGDVIESITIIR